MAADAHPLLYEINARHWLSALREVHGPDLDLGSVPESELERLQRQGFTHLWLMGVWPTGPRSRAQAVEHPHLRGAYDEALPGWNEEDIVGSPYAVQALEVASFLGGDAALRKLRERLAERGIRLILDFVPNHLGLDHAWVREAPLRFVGQPMAFADSFFEKTPSGPRYFAHGKDPYFPGWTDTVQLEYRRRETREGMIGALRSIATRCDGVRCDMAMLLLSGVFERTWAHVPLDGQLAEGEFWKEAIDRVKEEWPGFLFLAEAYWDLEGALCGLGFDYAYDKKLYDFLVHDHVWSVQPHVLGMGGHNASRAHFLENHDEPRVASLLDVERQRVSMTLALGLPGMRFVHDGQHQGARTFARVQLKRRLAEPTNGAVGALYGSLFEAFRVGAVGRGQARILEPQRAWAENPTSQCMLVVEWEHRGQGGQRALDLVVVNLAPHRSQCRVRLKAEGLWPGRWVLMDRLGQELWLRDGAELAGQGLYLDLPARGAQLFSIQPAG